MSSQNHAFKEMLRHSQSTMPTLINWPQQLKELAINIPQMSHPLPHAQEHEAFNGQILNAIYWRNARRVAHLLADMRYMATANLNAIAPTGATGTALHAALSDPGCPIEILKLLIPLVDPNILSADGESALMLAAGLGLPSICEDLVARGARADAQDTRGRTPLMIAAATGNQATIKALLPHSDPRHRCYFGQTPMIAAILRIKDDCERMGHAASRKSHTWRALMASADLAQSDINGQTPLHYAALTCSRWPSEIGQELIPMLALRSSVDARNGDGETALEVALREAPDNLLPIFEQAALAASCEKPQAPKQRPRSL